MTSSPARAEVSSEFIPPPTPRMGIESLVVFAVTASAFLLLRSHNLTAVDGPIRAFDIYREPHLKFHSSSHMLYPVYVLVWTQAIAKLGVNLADPRDFIRAVQAMNALLAAGCSAILFALVRTLTGSRKLGIAATLSWALANAVLLHATNAAEPMPGLFVSVCALAVAITSVRRNTFYLMIPAGFLLAFAMASYQSMVFIGMACGLVALLWQTDGGHPEIGVRIHRAAVLALSFLLGNVLIYGVCYWIAGAHTLHQVREVFFTVPAKDVYGGLSFAKAMNLPVGLANAVVVSIPHDYEGLRWLFRTQRFWIARTLMTVAVIAGIFLWSGFRKQSASVPAWLRPFTIACLSSLALGLGLQFYWQPLYDKLWLQPLWILALLLFTRSAFAARPSRVSKLALAGLAIAGMALNLGAAIQSARGPWPNFDEANRVATLIGPNDFVITDWSSVALLYSRIWAGDARSMDFPTTVCAHPSAGINEMTTRIATTQARGDNVYFLGTLDLTKSVWDPFLGRHCGVAYESLQTYREQARTVADFRSDEGTISLKRLIVPSEKK